MTILIIVMSGRLSKCIFSSDLGSGTFGNVYKARIREDKKALAHNLVPTQDVIVKKVCRFFT